MSDDTNGSASQNGEGVTVEALQQQLTEIVAERDGMKTKLRTLESASSELKKLTAERDNLLVEKSNIYSQLETFKKQVKDKEVDQHVSTALEAAKAKNPSTVRKLLDLGKLEFGDGGQVVQESLVKLIEGVKQTDPYLFAEPESEGEAQKKGPSTSTTGANSGPGVKTVASDTARIDAYQLALDEAIKSKDMNKLNEVLKKFGKL
jgi:hypothetical protein